MSTPLGRTPLPAEGQPCTSAPESQGRPSGVRGTCGLGPRARAAEKAPGPGAPQLGHGALPSLGDTLSAYSSAVLVQVREGCRWKPGAVWAKGGGTLSATASLTLCQQLALNNPQRQQRNTPRHTHSPTSSPTVRWEPLRLLFRPPGTHLVDAGVPLLLLGSGVQTPQGREPAPPLARRPGRGLSSPSHSCLSRARCHLKVRAGGDRRTAVRPAPQTPALHQAGLAGPPPKL